MLKDLGSNSGECHFYLFGCVLSFSATLAKRLNAQFRQGLAMNSTMLIQITAFKYQKNKYAKEIESTVDIRRKILLTMKNVEQKYTRRKESDGVNRRCESL